MDQKRVDLLAERTKLEEDNRDLKGQIELLKNDKVTLGHEKAILDKEMSYKDKALSKSEAEVLYFKNICHGPQVSQYPSIAHWVGPPYRKGDFLHRISRQMVL